MRRTIGWGGLPVALSAAVLLAAPAAPQSSDLAAALRAIDRGDDAAARAALAARRVESGIWLAIAARGAARLAAARDVLDDPAASDWMRSAAAALIAEEEGPPEAAIGHWQQATAQAPGDPRLWKLLGDRLAAAGDPAGARGAYGQVVALAPEHPAANIALGDLARARGDFGAAFNAYNHAVDAAGEPVAARFGRATARLYLGDAPGAIAELEEVATRAEPGATRARALMGIFYAHAYTRRIEAGLPSGEAAVRVWEELGRFEQAAALANAIGRVLLETGNPAQAEAWYERGGELIGRAGLAAEAQVLWQVRRLHGLARAAAAQRLLPRARQLAAEAALAMAGDPSNAEHYAWIGPYLEGYLLLAERRFAEAAVELQRSDTERPHIAWLVSDALARSRDREGARSWAARALEAADGLDAESVIVRPLALEWLQRNR